MNPKDSIVPETGRISASVDVTEILVRTVRRYGLLEELDGRVLEDEDEDGDDLDDDGDVDDGGEGEREEVFEQRLQGRIVNATKHRLSDVKYDLSYFDAEGSFLGLNRSRFLDEDELDVDDHLPIDMRVELPEGTVRCVFNVRAKRPGFLGRMFWG